MSIMNLRAALREHDEASQAAISAADGIRAAATPDTIRQLLENHDRLGRMLAERPADPESVASSIAFDALGKIVSRIEACGGSPELTSAVILASDLRQAIGNQWNKPCAAAMQRVLAAMNEPEHIPGLDDGAVPAAEPAIDEAALRDALEEPEPAPEYDFAALRARLEEDLVQHDVDMLLPEHDDDRPSVSAQHEVRFIREMLAAYDELHRLKGGAPVTLTIEGALADAGILLDDTEGGSHD